MENTNNTEVMDQVVTQEAVLEEAGKKAVEAINTQKYGFTDYAMLGLAGVGALAILGAIGFGGYKGIKAIKAKKASKEFDIAADEGVRDIEDDVFEDEDEI